MSALYLIRPNQADFHELRSYFQDKNAWQMYRSGSEQTALVCHYKASSRLDTWPCSVPKCTVDSKQPGRCRVFAYLGTLLFSLLSLSRDF